MPARNSYLMAILMWLIIGTFAPSGQAFAQGAENKIKAGLATETQVPVSGSTIMIAITMTAEPGWHGYWKNPGEAGFPGRYEWTLPKGVTVGDIRYPVPERLLVSDLMNHVYNGDHALLVPLKVPAGLAKGTPLPIRLSADWLACTDKICVPQRGEANLALVVGDGAVAQADRAQFDKWRAKLPRPLGSVAHFQVAGETLKIAVPYPQNLSAPDPWFFAETENAVSYPAPQNVTRSGDMLIIEAKAAGPIKATSLKGVLAFGKSQGLEIDATPGIVSSGSSSASASVGIVATLLAFGGAVLGGLFLNIMPCVFPVISLKAMSLARAGGDAASVKKEAIAYAVGVVAVCMALGGTLLALRAGGAQVGWAFQLQEPRVILVLLILVTAITANLAGFFSLPSFGGGQALVDRGGTAGAFWTGALAAFVATPCTGPFMGAALGAALVLPTAAALAIFAGLGFGLALPFLLLGFVPALRNRMPRPGPWMERFQRILAIPMLLTAMALVWLLWRQTGQSGLIIGVAFGVVGAALLWVMGRRQGRGAKIGAIAGAFLAVSAIALVALPKASVSAKPAGMLGEFAFDEVRLQQLRTSGRPVFLYFTADWCLTCKVNEKAAIEREDVAAAFKARNVAVMVGDWTNGDPAISRFLEAQGRSGVPLYLYYRPNTETPVVLPQVLTPGLLTRIAQP